MLDLGDLILDEKVDGIMKVLLHSVAPLTITCCRETPPKTSAATKINLKNGITTIAKLSFLHFELESSNEKSCWCRALIPNTNSFITRPESVE